MENDEIRELILASASPRSQELLRLAGIPFRAVPALGEERIDPALSPPELALTLARQKALEVQGRCPGRAVLGADTLVALEGVVFGKPRDDNHAREMLGRLSGMTHSVFTGVCLLRPDSPEISFCQESRVTFHALSQREINAYVATGEAADKAGAYGIQGRGGLFVERLEGDYWNVVGLPLARLLKEINVDL